MQENQPKTDVPEQNAGNTPNPEANLPITPKFELKDGAMTLDGRKVVYEKDLIAAKESLQKQIDTVQTVHNEAIDNAKLALSDNQTMLAQANAKLQLAEDASKSGAPSQADPEEVARLKQEAETAKSSIETATGQVLEYRKKLIMASYPNQVKAEQLEGKDASQLDAFEEALKALSQSLGGPGPYAVGSGVGGGALPTEMDRAKALLAATPVRGVRNPPLNSS